MSYSTIKHLSLIKISGADANGFLQGQLTNDVNQLNSQWHYSGYCSPKGRLLALLRLWQSEEIYYALMASDIVESVCKRLKMYVMRSKVEVEILVDANIIALTDKHALSQLKPDFDALPENELQRMVSVDDEGFLLSDPVTQNYLYIEQQPSQKISYQQDIEHAWEQQNLLAGIPQISAATSELFVPQMINLDLLDGINFKKGCYTGQEIVARMHYLGKLKQRLFLCELEGEAETSARAGDKVYADNALSKTTGTLLALAPQSNATLAVMRLSELESPHQLENGQRLIVNKQQPFSFPLSSNP